MSDLLTIGVDVGTQGVRSLCLADNGAVMARAGEEWPLRRGDDGTHEQDPAVWWGAALRSLEQLLAALSGQERSAVQALSVTSTSGTLLLLDAQGKPLRPAIMWDDKRATPQADLANERLQSVCDHNGYRFRPTFSLPKAMWLRENEAAVWARLTVLCHAADWLTARLVGRARPVTEATNALKSGYDLVQDRWPDELERVGVDRAVLPDVVPSGQVVGDLRVDLAKRLGLSPRVAVAIGMTDANTALVSAGVVRPGTWTTGISTGLSVKGVTASQIKDGRGGLYCHRHAELGWIPSCTMHTGGDVLTERFGNDRLAELDVSAGERGPASVLTFPLQRRGEFFPIYAPEAEGFTIGVAEDEVDAYRSCLEGVALMEALAYDTCRELGASVEGPIVTSGGGSHSELWSQIRADVIGRPVCRPVEEGTALGAAIVALASQTDGLISTVERIVRHTDPAEPDKSTAEHYGERKAEFVEAFVERGFQLIAPSIAKPEGVTSHD